VDDPRNGLRPDRPAIESMEIFAGQATLVIDTYNRYAALQSAKAALEEEVQRVKEAAEQSQRMLPVLLHKDLEQNIAIQRFSRQVRSMSMGLNLSENVGRQESRQDVLLNFARELLVNLEMDQVLVAEMGEGGPRLLHTLGSIPPNVNPQALLGQRNPLRAVMTSGKPLYVENVAYHPDWQSSPLLITLEASSFICLPIVTGYYRVGQETRAQVDSAILLMTGMPIPQITEEDRSLYSLLSRQVSTALQNLAIVAETNRRFMELNLLLEFSRQISGQDIEGMLGNLVQSIEQVIPAVQAGWVALWEPAGAVLQPRFATGYPRNDILLEIPFRAGEALPGQVFESGQARQVAEVDFAQMYNLAKDYLLKYRDATAGRLPVSSLLVPLQAFDACLGVIVLDNFTTVGAFGVDDQALVSSLAQQVAVTLTNLRLVQAAKDRAAQLQALTEVAGSISSSLDEGELTASILAQVSTILSFDTSTLWLRQANRLVVKAAQGFTDSEERVGLSVELSDSLLLQEMVANSQPLSVGDVRSDPRFPSLVEAQYLSWLGVPLLSKGEVGGVLVLEKREPNFYKTDDIQLILTFAGQAAVALENARLYQESLRRAQELDERSQRMALLNRLSASLSESLDLANILSAASRELFQALPGESIALAILQKNGEMAIQAEEPLVSNDLPYILPHSGLVERLRQSLGVFTAEDVQEEKDLDDLAEFFQRYATRALLILPMAVGNELIGLAFIHLRRAYRYAPEEVALGLTISNQVAVALQNARLFEESERLFNETRMRSSELSVLFDLGVNLTQVRDEQRLLELTFSTIQSLLAPDAILVVLAENEMEMVAHFFENGQRLPPQTHPRHGASYSEHVLATSQPLLIGNTLADEKPTPGVQAGIPCKCWLGVPLVGRGSTIGVLSVQSYTPNQFGENHLRLVGQVANQLSVAIDNAQLFRQVESYAAELEQRVEERTEQVAREHRRMQSLLQITTELSASLDLDMVLNRTLDVINASIGAEHSSLLLLQSETPTLFLRAGKGYIGEVAKGGQQASLMRSEGLAGWVIHNRQPVLIDDTQTDPRWVQRTDMTRMHRSAMAVPLLVGEEILGVLMLYHRQVQAFSADQLEMMQATAKQIAIALNNAQLYGLIRDQAERLGEMLRTQHIETSRSQAILEAVADGVLVTDANRKVTLFNASAEQILNLRRADILGRPLDHMLGLFGGAGAQWSRTIDTWSSDPSTYKGDDLFAEQFELENRKVVSVHLSPVRLRNNFLGTVSIFRDITHEVEVDRLKSEFVATVSHELRTPMTSIKGYVDILLMGAAGQLSPQQNTFLTVVKQSTERLSVLVNDLLDVSRIEAGKIDLSMQPLDLSRIVSDVITAFRRRATQENRPMNFHIEAEAGLARAWGDEERVRQVIENLVENAYQYTHPDGNITLRLRQVGEEIQTDVIDTGIGIKPTERERIFERFYRGEDPLVYASSGNGLGLAIVKTMVEMHAGRLWFESSGVEGQGSTFSFTLPVYKDQR
jgi:K+-sensing histidine kinase KdpD